MPHADLVMSPQLKGLTPAFEWGSTGHGLNLKKLAPNPPGFLHHRKF